MTKKFMQYLYLLAAFVSVFLSGGYAAAAMRHGEYIAPYRWLITAGCAVFFVYQSGAFARSRNIGWTTEVPTRTGWYLVRQQMYNGCGMWSRYTPIKLERKMFKLYIATDDYLSARLFDFPEDNDREYLWLEDA